MTTNSRDRLVLEARRWIGTPYQHQASLKGAGCDCLGLIRGVWRACIGPEPERFEPYSADWAEATREERLALAGARHFSPVALESFTAFCAAHCASKPNSATESGPPDTPTKRASTPASFANSAAVSVRRSGSALASGNFPLRAALHRG